LIEAYLVTSIVPVSQTTLKTLYIFVEIAIDPLHLGLSVRRNFPSEKEAFQRSIVERLSASSSSTQNEKGKGRLEIGIEGEQVEMLQRKTKIALVSTVQFISAVHSLREALEEALPELKSAAEESTTEKTSLLRMKAEEVGVWRGAYEIVIPQSKPLSPGEVLGCTAPKLDSDVDALM